MAEKEKTDASLREALRTTTVTAESRAALDALKLKPTGQPKLVEIEGKLGVFTPVSDPGKIDESEQNLGKVVQVLQEEVARLQSDNQQLSERFKQIGEAKRRTPDDFASAISHTVDSLQTRLYETKNPVSRFALKELEIEANVHVDVTAVGTVDYRFIQPEEDVDPNRLSRIRMSLVPLPRETTAGAWSSPAFTPFRDIEEIQGIGEIYQRKLNQQNIFSLSDLLNAGTRVRSKVELAAMLGVDRNKLAVWLSHAELMTVKEIDGRKAQVLHDLGIDTLEGLAVKDPGGLAADFNERAEAIGHETIKPVEETEATRWIEAARAYAGTQKAPAADKKTE